MSGTVELPDDVYEQLQAAAAAAGTTPAEWFAAGLTNPCPSPVEDGLPRGCSLADAPTVALELPCSVFERLQDTASQSGSTPEEWIAARLPAPPRVFVTSSGEPARTLADLMEGLIGQYSSGGAEGLAENHSALFGEYLEEKRRDGRL